MKKKINVTKATKYLITSLKSILNGTKWFVTNLTVLIPSYGFSHRNALIERGQIITESFIRQIASIDTRLPISTPRIISIITFALDRPGATLTKTTRFPLSKQTRLLLCFSKILNIHSFYIF